MKKTPYLHILLFICIVGIISIPTLVFAQDAAAQINKGFGTFGDIITRFTQTIVRSLATLFATAAMVAFFYGIVKYIWGIRDGDSTASTNGKNFMLWGLIALFVMFSVWGIINYAQGIFGIAGKNTIVIPQIEFGSGKKSVNPSGQGLPTGATPSGGESGGYRNGSDVQSDNASTPSGGSSNTSATSPCANDPDGLTQYDPESRGCVRPSGDAGSSSGSGSSALGQYIQQCQNQDPSKSYTTCWQEYSNNNPPQSTTETTPQESGSQTTQQNDSSCGGLFGCDDTPFDPANCDEGWHVNSRGDGCTPD